ncbi:phosphatidylserine decarboxylase proenzyme [Parachlamydia acanthamoebae UV-7]|uniref:Phosphatidylserine decarboxylase proenzyme n=1 Tax=Parachlamydia acanthamoebae (strain UV7) TaxID=765952 RepID=F8KWI4_PARAV|nr:phosphatidylserine decarboxylase [Parachlamydia acanthamoebae]CCB85382.1 phosphatidylserine decarboxylase proenzyme [Parachlamydia acanthamoebae UV-7]
MDCQDPLNMETIQYIDRLSQTVETEKVYGGQFLKLLYGRDLLSRTLGASVLFFLARFPIFSSFYGWWQSQSWTAKKIQSFIDAFQVNPSEFALPVEQFKSFNDFFIRKLKPDARPLAKEENVAIMPADGRYLCYQNIETIDGFVVKGKKFSLDELLKDSELANRYRQATMVMARLCPTDYHRYHFPCECIPGITNMIPGDLYSVNPIAIRQNVEIFTENKRTLCELETAQFGKVLFIEIGATFVGSIHQTYTPHSPIKKGDEKGYFSFGGSSLILLFEPNTLHLDEDLVQASLNHIETKCLMGQSLGRRL